MRRHMGNHRYIIKNHRKSRIRGIKHSLHMTLLDNVVCKRSSLFDVRKLLIMASGAFRAKIKIAKHSINTLIIQQKAW